LVIGLAVISGCSSKQPEPHDGSVNGPQPSGPAPEAAFKLEPDRLGQEQIWEGADAPGTDYVVAIGYKAGNGLTVMCSGVALARDRILTAGHCFKTCDERDWWVSSQFNVADSAKPMRPVTKIIRHHGYEEHESSGPYKKFENDLAVLEVKGGKFASWPLHLRSSISSRAAVKKIGYGWTKDKDDSNRGKRTSGTGAVDAIGELDLSFVFDEPFSICNFDSGGPTFTLKENGEPSSLVGITSTMLHPQEYAPDALCSSDGLDVAVDAYGQWIEQAMEGRCTCDTRCN
jgi:secreted trypsin-like serine protease